MSGACPRSTATALRAASTPIAVRVSIVAEPRCGISVDVVERDQPGVDLRLVLENVQAGSGDDAGRQRLGEGEPHPRPARGWC